MWQLTSWSNVNAWTKMWLTAHFWQLATDHMVCQVNNINALTVQGATVNERNHYMISLEIGCNNVIGRLRGTGSSVWNWITNQNLRAIRMSLWGNTCGVSHKNVLVPSTGIFQSAFIFVNACQIPHNKFVNEHWVIVSTKKTLKVGKQIVNPNNWSNIRHFSNNNIRYKSENRAVEFEGASFFSLALI